MKIKSFEEACAVKGYDPAKMLPDVSLMPSQHQDAITAFAKLIIIAEAINFNEDTKEQWVPDWNDDDEYKYFPWFDLEHHKKNNPSGFRFDGSGYGVTVTRTSGGSRLCYQTRANSDYAGTQFIDLYRALIKLPE